MRQPNIRTISLKTLKQSITIPLKLLLSRITSPNTIERINLIFMKSLEGTDLQSWKEIDVILRSERFATLRHVGLYVLFSDEDHEWLMTLSDQLHSLNSKEILEVQSSEVCQHRLLVIMSCSSEMYDPRLFI